MLLALALAAAQVAAVPKGSARYDAMYQYADQGQWEKALPMSQELLKENPTFAFSWMVLGWSYRFTDRYAEAIPAFEKAEKLGAMQPYRVELELAICEAGLGHKKEALGHIQKSLDDGLPDRGNLRKEKHFDSLKDDATFKKLAAVVDPATMTRDQRWSYDLNLLVTDIQRVHFAPYQFTSKESWEKQRKDLEGRIPKLNDIQMSVEFMKLMRQVNDGHSRMNGTFQDAEKGAGLPVLFGGFADGFYLAATTKQYEPYLWSKVTAIDGMPIDDVFKALDCITPQDNELRPRTVSPNYMRFPQILNGLGIAKSPDKVTLSLVDRNGETKTLDLGLVTGTLTDLVREPADRPGKLLPAIVKRPDLYYLEYLADSKTLIFHYNGVANKADETVGTFSEKLRTAMHDKPVDKLVVDLRWNGGGNNFLNVPLLNVIAGDPVINKPGHLYVLTTTNTFSAAICFTEQLDRYTNAIIVGEPTCSAPNFIGESIPITLPCTGMKGSISNLFWQNGPAMDARRWVAPQIFVPYRFADCISGRDVYLEAVLNDHR